MTVMCGIFPELTTKWNIIHKMAQEHYKYLKCTELAQLYPCDVIFMCHFINDIPILHIQALNINRYEGHCKSSR